MPTVVRLALVSHGTTPALRAARFPADESIDPAAARTATELELPPARRVLLAPERRARETADACGLHGEVDGRISDLDCGRWRGESLLDVDAEQSRAWLTDPGFRGHGGESVEDLLRRVAGWLDAVAEAGEDVVAFGHPAVARAAVVASLGAPAAAFWRIDVAPLSITRLHHRGAWTLRLVG